MTSTRRACTGIIILALFLGSHTSRAQRIYHDLKEALTSQSKLTGRRGPASVNWIDQGQKFSFTENAVIKIFDPATKKEEVVFDGTGKKFPGSDKSFGYSSFQWSQDSKFIVFQTNTRAVWRNSGISDYYLFTRATGEMKLLAKDAYTAELSPDGKKVGYEKGGNLYMMDLEASRETQFTNDGKPGFYNGRFGWAYEEEFGLVQAWKWSPDGKQIAFWQSDETRVPIFQYTNYQDADQTSEKVPYPKPGDPIPVVRIGVITVASRDLKWMNVDSKDGYLPRIYWTANPGQLAIVRLNRKQNDMEVFLTDTLDGRTTMILEEKSEQWVEIFSFPVRILDYLYFPADTKEFFWRSERDGWSHIYRYDYTGKLINQVTKGAWEAVKVVGTDLKDKTVYYLSTEDSPLERQLYSIGFDGKHKKKITTAPGMHTVDFSAGNRFFIDTYSNLQIPLQVDVRDVKGALVKNWEDNKAVADYVKDLAYIRPEIETFTTTDGQKIDISIAKPAGFDVTKKYPVILHVYGGPEFQAVANRFETDGWLQYLCQQGFIIVKVNNRGGGGYGAAFKKVVYGKLGVYETRDFSEAALYVAAKPWADRNNIGIYGHSYGGFTSSYSMLRHPGVFKCAIVAAPVTDWRNYDAIYTERYMGVLPENQANYDSSAVVNFVGNLKGDFFIAHSTFDDNVHVINTMQLVKRLIDHGMDAELRLYQSGGHRISYDLNSQVLLHQQYTAFFNKELRK